MSFLPILHQDSSLGIATFCRLIEHEEIRQLMSACQLLSNPLDDSALLLLLGASGLEVGTGLGKGFLDSLLDAQRSREQLEPLWTVMAGMATDEAAVKTRTRNAILKMRRWHAEFAASASAGDCCSVLCPGRVIYAALARDCASRTIPPLPSALTAWAVAPQCV